MKPIKTTLIIGNGFDLSLGMKTSYKQFYDYLAFRSFFTKHGELPLIEYIKNATESELWYDFECIIKEFATKSREALVLIRLDELSMLLDDITSVKDLTEVCQYEDLDGVVDSLGDLMRICQNTKSVTADVYDEILVATKNIQVQIREIQNAYKADAEKAIELLTKSMCAFLSNAHPFDYTTPAMQILLAVFGIRICNDGTYEVAKKVLELLDENDKYVFPGNIRIISFNYTDSLSSIGRILERVGIALCLQNSECKNIIQIHGKLHDSIAFGSDNDNRIPKEYKCLCKSHVLNGSPICDFMEHLNASERVVIFGHSVHGLDYEYYKDFFMSQPTDTEVYIVCHNQEACEIIRDSLEARGIPQFVKYVSIDNERDFKGLCDKL